jgi:uncharacterized protein YkwD
MKISRSLQTAVAPATLLFFLFSPIIPAQNLPPYASQSSQSSPSIGAAERALLDASNRERAAQGLPALAWDAALAAAAQRHATRMAEEHAISHQFPGEAALLDRTSQAGAHFSLVAENVAEGPDTETIHSGWMHSAGHRANILDPQLTAIGIAVVSRGRQLYAVQDFAHRVESLSLEEQEKKVGALLFSRGLQIVSGNDDARRSCASGHQPSYNGSIFIVRFEATDIGKLPDGLEKVVRERKYAKASVGACEAGGDPGFTKYRIAVLLF